MTVSVCRVMVGAGAADGLGDPLADPDGLGDAADADALPLDALSIPGTPTAWQSWLTSGASFMDWPMLATSPSCIHLAKSTPNWVPWPRFAIFWRAGSCVSVSVAGPFSQAPSARHAATALPEGDAAGVLVLLLVTSATITMTTTRISGGATTRKGVRRQKGFGP